MQDATCKNKNKIFFLLDDCSCQDQSKEQLGLVLHLHLKSLVSLSFPKNNITQYFSQLAVQLSSGWSILKIDGGCFTSFTPSHQKLHM